jgi:hypothetical protein
MGETTDPVTGAVKEYQCSPVACPIVFSAPIVEPLAVLPHMIEPPIVMFGAGPDCRRPRSGPTNLVVSSGIWSGISEPNSFVRRSGPRWGLSLAPSATDCGGLLTPVANGATALDPTRTTSTPHIDIDIDIANVASLHLL